MSNLAEIQKHRLRLYGEMLKSDLTERRNQQRLQKQANLKRDSLDLQRHIQNARRMELTKKMQIKEMNHALKQDNLMLSTLKKSINMGKTYAEQGHNFMNEIQQMDSRRLSRLKNDLVLQYQDNKDFTSNKRMIQEKIKQIEKLQAQRHANRVKEIQQQSIKNYQEIKKKHQQDMTIFQRHKKLVEENQNYRDQIESFTNIKGGILERFNRNEYLQRRTSMRQNQDEIVKQMEQFQRRKHQDSFEYKRKVGDLEDSMLASILSKPPRYEARAYSHELKNQMKEDNLKRYEELNVTKQKIQINNIFGGVPHGNQRQKMIRIIDRGLGIDRYSRESLVKNKLNLSQSEINNQSQMLQQNNPELKQGESQRYPTPKSAKRSQQLDYSQQCIPQNAINNELPRKEPSQFSNTNSQNRRYFKSYDLIAGKNKFYGAE